MARVNDWFLGFISSFKTGDTQISEKQFNIFSKYLDEPFSDGYIRGYRGEAGGYRLKAYEWSRVNGRAYYIEKIKKEV